MVNIFIFNDTIDFISRENLELPNTDDMIYFLTIYTNRKLTPVCSITIITIAFYNYFGFS